VISSGWTLPLRAMQGHLLTAYKAQDLADFLAVIATGAGKTIGALRILHALLENRTIRRTVIVVPSRTLRLQWMREAHKVGIKLDVLDNDDGMEPADFDGCVLTYGQLFSNPDLHGGRCRRVPTAVVFDEVHHLGDQSAWGQAARAAFSALGGVTASGQRYLGDEVEEARRFVISELGIGSALSDEECIRLVRKWRAAAGDAGPARADPPNPFVGKPWGSAKAEHEGAPECERRRDLKSATNDLVKKLAGRLKNATREESFADMNYYQLAHLVISRRAGICHDDEREPTTRQLEARKAAAADLLASALQAIVQGDGVEFVAAMYREIKAD